MTRGPWLRVHLYIGLVAGLLLAFAGLTGSLLVFDHAIDEWLNRELLVAPHDPETRVSAQAAVAAAAGTGHAPVLLNFPRKADRAFIVEARGANGSPWAGQRLQIPVDPRDGTVLGVRPAETHLMAVIYRLHHTLLLARNGEVAMGIAGLFVVISLGSGVYLWWPGRGKLGRALVVKRGAAPVRVIFDLHRTFGIYSMAVLLAVVLTGIYLVFPDYVRPLVAQVSPLSEVPTGVRSAPPGPGAAPIGLDAALAAARRVFPEGEVKFVLLPRDDAGVYRIAVRQPGEVRRSGALSGVAVAPGSGKVLAVIDSRDATAGDVFLNWLFPIHNGEAFGLAGRWIVFVVGLVPSVLYTTGFVLWRLRRAARRHRVARLRAAETRAGGRAGSRTRIQ